MASIEERFQAAVNVIKGLPKNGPYQPSAAMMLKFYGYYKQATEGVCHQKRPGFWDIVGRAKWDAWNSNRHLTKQQAMTKYVDELREIIETMSFTENVQNFVGSISGLDNINLDELDMIVPGMREIAESHPNSPFNSRTNSPQHGKPDNKSLLNGDVGADESEHNGGHDIPETLQQQQQSQSQQQQQQQIVIATPIPTYAHNGSLQSVSTTSNGTMDQSDDEYGDPLAMQHDFSETMMQNSELLKQIQATVLRMNADIMTVNQRMRELEKSVQEVRSAVQKVKSGVSSRGGRQYPKWWPFQDISPAWFLLLIAWPFVARRLSRMMVGQRRN